MVDELSDEVSPEFPTRLSDDELKDYLAEVKAKKLTIVNLDYCGLEEIPREIFTFTWVEELLLNGNSILRVESEIAKLQNLRVLSLWSNPNLVLSDAVGALRRLEEISIGPQASRLPRTLGHCTELREVAIGDNGLNEVPDWLLSLPLLREVQLWGNHITEIPERLGQLTELTELNLGDNEITSLPDSMRNLVKLESLKLYGNFLPEVPPCLFECTALSELNLRKNIITLVPSRIGRLTQLEILDLSGNPINSLPAACANFRKLRILHLQSTRISAIPSSISKMKSLELLNIAAGFRYEVLVDYNLDLPEDDPDHPYTSARVEISSSGKLFRNDSQYSIRTVPRAIVDLPRLRYLLLHGHRLDAIPVEIVDQVDSEDSLADAAEALLRFLRAQSNTSVPLNEGKLILLGWGGAGKTSLVNRLVRNTFSPTEVRTEGIAVTRWDTKRSDGRDVAFNIWDFGGQEIMHATHQFFLTARSVYIVVLTGRNSDADNSAAYWLNIIDSFAPESPVIVVLNQIEKDPFEIDTRTLRLKYPQVRSVLETDCAIGPAGLGIDHLRSELKNLASSMEELDVLFPRAWLNIKERLSDLDRDYLTFEEFRSLCEREGEARESSQEELADYLHLLGSALNFRDDARLRDTHVLNPRWVTEGIYAILNSEIAARRGGIVSLADLMSILPQGRYPSSKHQFLIELMRKFELCFPFQDSTDRVLIPDLLSKQFPSNVPELDRRPDSLRFKFKYSVLPEAVFPRFIVRSYVLSAGKPRWRSGVVLEWEGNTALVTADRSSNVIQIAVGGPLAGRRMLLALIRSDLNHIHQNYSFNVTPLVPAPDSNFDLDYNELRAFEQAGLKTAPKLVNGAVTEIDVTGVLNGVAVPSLRPSDQVGDGAEPALVFISYSHFDREHLARLNPHLKLLQMRGAIRTWVDQEIRPGDDWESELHDNLRNAQIYVALLSPEYLASNFVNEVELPVVWERAEQNASSVLAVVVRDCMWNMTRFSTYQLMPTDGSPLSSATDVDAQWKAVAEEILEAARRAVSRRGRRRAP